MLQPLAYLTCELKGRDLASRLLIADSLVERGYAVVVGQQWGIFSNLRACPKGVILFKTANKAQAEWMAEARNQGHVVVASDEECLASSPTDYARLTHPDAARACHTYLALNELHATAIKEAYPEADGKIVIAGNARIDILRSLQPPRPIVNPYVLVNTSFGRLNHVSGSVQAAIDLWIGSGGHEVDSETERMVRDRLSFEERALAETLAVIKWVLENTRIQVVIRPHPAERHETWPERYGDNQRVRIVTQSDPAPWMKHAEIIIHSESTTGVEAAVMGRRALNLSPVSSWADRLIVSQVNVTARSAAEATSIIETTLQTGAWPSPTRDLDALYPAGGATNTADAIARHLPPARRMTDGLQWHLINRTDMQRDKFTVAYEEAAALTRHNLVQMDDSLFLLTPRTLDSR